MANGTPTETPYDMLVERIEERTLALGRFADIYTDTPEEDTSSEERRKVPSSLVTIGHMSYLHATPSESSSPDPRNGPPIITSDDLASPLRRIGATLIDGLIWAIPIAIGTYFAVDINEVTDSIEFNYPAWWSVGVLLFGLLYYVVPIAIWGQTLGKHLVKVRVVSAQDLTRPGWWRSIRRWGIYVVLGLVPFVGGLLNLLVLVISLVFLWSDKRRQVIHDKVANTIVVVDGVHRY